jgi:diadenosine tetraphosphate (Ap4A) HIT family hydrolase
MRSLAGAWLLTALFAVIPAAAQLDCGCDISQPASLNVRPCSLCAEVERHSSAEPAILVKDISPTKPNRWLALPRAHSTGMHRLADLTADERRALWQSAIDKAKSLWGDGWGIAMNGEARRTQCHVHLHIGKLLPDQETGDFVVVPTAAHIPLAGDAAIWIHPILSGSRKGSLHVHVGEQVAETVLYR